MGCVAGAGGGRVSANARVRRCAGWSLLLAAMLGGCARPSPPPGTDQVQVWTTTADHRLALAPSRVGFDAGDAVDGATTGAALIEIDASARHQQMVGFGVSITDASAWLIRQKMSPAQREALLRELFGRDDDGIGFDFARLTIGASDFSRHHYSLDDPPEGQPDPALRHFSLDVNRGDLIPVARQALAINPELWIMASPWSAPAWMKDSGHLITGRLSPDHYDAFARYLLRYVEAMAGEGISIRALTVQNEPDFESKDYPVMRLNAPARARFIGDHLGPLLARQAPQVQLFDWDHNWDKLEEPLAVLADPVAARYVDAVAWHCYAGQPVAQSQVRRAHPDVDVYMTECSGGDWEPVRSGGLTLQVERLIVETTRNWARGVLFWNLALDENSGPHAGGCGNCRGVVTIDSKTGEVSRTDDYYALAHASRFVRRGAWRVASSEALAGVANVAFVNHDDSRVLVVSNADPQPRAIRVREGGRSFRHLLPGGSVVTFRWHPAGR
jgi:glucosylceramidase